MLLCECSDTQLMARNAYETVFGRISELITHARQVEDEEVLRWVAWSLFRVTVSMNDESANHIIFSDESIHPYRPNENIKRRVDVPGASSLLISFDERCSLESETDNLAFYKDEGCTKLIKKIS